MIYFLRHAQSEANLTGVLAGRMPGVALSTRGKKQAVEVAKTLSSFEFSAIYSSPIERCLETVAPLAKVLRKRVRVSDDFIEMDYGKWSGKKLSLLSTDPLWRKIQGSPSKVTFPDGESFLAAERRIRRGIRRIAHAHPKGKVLIVSHGDPIKIALQISLNGELDDFQRLVIDPASISIVQWPTKVIYGINQPATRSVTLKTGSNRRALGGGSDRA